MISQATFVRAYPSEIEQTGPRQLTGRLVPYDVVADVVDELPDGQMEVYQEGFRSGAFAPQANIREPGVISKISLIHRHNGGLGYLGPFVSLREASDGLYGDVSVLRSRADDVEDLLASGVQELSVEFRLPRGNHTFVDEAGVRWRTRAHLDQVALEARGAYSSAQVLAYRAAIDEAQQARAEAEEAEAAEAEEHKRALEEAEAIAERRRRFEEITGRLDKDVARQQQYIREYGITKIDGVPPRQC